MTTLYSLTNQIHPTWKSVLREYFESSEFYDESVQVDYQYRAKHITPSNKEQILAPYMDALRNPLVVVISYIAPQKSATGRGLEVKGRRYRSAHIKSMEKHLGPYKGSLEHWVSSGVLLLNYYPVATKAKSRLNGLTVKTLDILHEKYPDVHYILINEASRLKDEYTFKDGQVHLSKISNLRNGKTDLTAFNTVSTIIQEKKQIFLDFSF